MNDGDEYRPREGAPLSATERLGIRLARWRGFSTNQVAAIFSVSPRTVAIAVGKPQTAEQIESLTLVELDACPTDHALFRELLAVVERNLAASLRRHGIAAPRGRLAVGGGDRAAA